MTAFLLKNKPNLWHFDDLNPERARSIQREWAGQVIKKDDFTQLRRVAGADVGYRGEVARAAVVVLRFPQLEGDATTIAGRPVGFPYVPGLLCFRETPSVLDAVRKLSPPPDLLLYDGHGLAHPRRFGAACCAGVLSGIPTIGWRSNASSANTSPCLLKRGVGRLSATEMRLSARSCGRAPE